MKKRAVLPRELQVSIFRRDGWLCCWCKRPVIFAPVMKYLERELRNSGHSGKVAYYHERWTRDGAPLLDELGAVIDHVAAFSSGGPCSKENLVTACNKCNGRKNAAPLDRWNQRAMRKPVKGKYGEPQHWDGLSSFFVMLTERDATRLTAAEKGWLRALKDAS